MDKDQLYLRDLEALREALDEGFIFLRLCCLDVFVCPLIEMGEARMVEVVEGGGNRGKHRSCRSQDLDVLGLAL